MRLPSASPRPMTLSAAMLFGTSSKIVGVDASDRCRCAASRARRSCASFREAGRWYGFDRTIGVQVNPLVRGIDHDERGIRRAGYGRKCGRDRVKPAFFANRLSAGSDPPSIAAASVSGRAPSATITTTCTRSSGECDISNHLPRPRVRKARRVGSRRPNLMS